MKIKNQFPFVDKTELWLIYSVIAVLIFDATILFGFAWQIGPFDYDHLAAYYEIAKRFWTEPGATLHFNPYMGGGRSLAADAQIPIFHPITFFSWLIGPNTTLRLEIWIGLVLGGIGFWKISALWNSDRSAKLWGLLLFYGGGALVSHVLAGHVTLAYFWLMPWLWYFSYHFDSNDKRKSSYTLFFLTLLYLTHYKPHFIHYGLPLFCTENFIRCFILKKFRSYYIFLGSIALVFLISAPSWLPALKYFSDFPRPTDVEFFSAPLHTWLVNLLMPIRTIPSFLYGETFRPRHEFNFFVTPVGFILAALAIRQWKELPVQIKSLVIMGSIFVLVGLGQIAGEPLISPLHWMRKLPGFESLRAPTRFWLGSWYAILALNVLIFQLPKSTLYKRLWIALGIVPLLGSHCINIGKIMWSSHDASAISMPLQGIWNEGSETDNLQTIQSGYSSLSTIQNMEVGHVPNFPAGPMFENFQAQNMFAEFKNWNRITLEGTYSQSPLVINLNHSPYWKISGTPGFEISSKWNELLTVSSQNPGPYNLELVYEQPWVRGAFYMSAVGTCLLLLLVVLKGTHLLLAIRLGLVIATGM